LSAFGNPAETVFRMPNVAGEKNAHGRRTVYLHPGQLHVGTRLEPAAISCVLGSCVELCLWDRKLKFGGAVHYLLPGVAGAVARNAGRQGIQELVAAMQRAGSQIPSLVGKVFGGACMIPELRGCHIGVRNVEMAQSCLSDLRIVTLEEDVLGDRGRKVIFHTDTGETTVRLI
jgi:chemotaxis protein CheD